MSIIDTNAMNTDQAYEARGIVARVQVMGHYRSGGGLIKSIHKYLTIDPGPGRDRYAVEYVRPAKMDEAGDLDMKGLKEGDIVVHPGFIYKKILWTDALMAEHLAALRNYRPKVIVKSDVDKAAGPVDLGVINQPPV